ncbi:MAG TPA: hypothetical protein PKA53_08930, partial [Sphingobacterium sp.]|nr:hypothetical protein [Sphingobacterium sp.]
MDDKDILILIEKLRSKTISSEELKSLRYVLYRTKDSKELLKLMHDEFRQSVESSPSLSDYGHSDLVKKRLEKNIGNGNVRIGQSKLFYWAASVAAACAVIGFVFFSQLSKDTKAGIVWETISTKHGERKKVSLGDG